MVEMLDFVFQGCLKQNICAFNIGFYKWRRIHNRPVDMAFCGKMDEGVYLVLGNGRIDKLAVTDVSVGKDIVRVFLDFLQVFQVSRIGQLIHVDDGVLRVLLEPVEDEVASDESRPTGNE